MGAEHQARLKQLRSKMKAEKLDAMIVANRTNTLYLTGFKCSYSLMIVDSREVRFVTDGRYAEAAQKALPDAKVIVQPMQKLDDFFRKDVFGRSGYASAGFETSITVAEHATLKKRARGIALKPAGNLIADLRAVKDATELKAIRKAVALADKMMAYAFDQIKPGAKEADVSKLIRRAAEDLGGEGEAFENIVASGPNSSRPHHRFSDRRMKEGDPVTLDLGGRVDGYCSDLTRNPFIGKVSKKMQDIYDVVLAANEKAIKHAKAGIACKELDAIARDHIAAAGYGDFFSHSLGHGVGLEIHEGPTLSSRAEKQTLAAGNIITIEPGIYIPGLGGVRIEDYVLVTDKGCQVLSKTPKELTVL